MAQQWAWKRQSRKKSSSASRRKPRSSSGCCGRKSPRWRHGLSSLSRGQRTPQNSSLPPSTQHPHARPQPPKRRSKKKRGGQAGHEKHERPLIPPEPVPRRTTPEADGKAWLWTFVARLFTVFAVRATREATALTTFLGETFQGIVNCDRAKWLGQRLRVPRANCLSIGPITAPVRSRARAASPHGSSPPEGGAFAAARHPERQSSRARTCRELYGHRGWLWTFLRYEGVEPTNNAGERALRHAVIWRKLSFGTQSTGGSRFVETMLTVIETCRQQRRNAFAFVATTVEAHLTHQSTPSLLPRA